MINNTVSPFSIQNARPGGAFNTAVSTPQSVLKKTQPIAPAPVSPTQPAPVQTPTAQSYTPASSAVTSSAPVKGLLTPGTASLAPVSTMPAPAPQTTFSGLVGGLANASQPNAQAQKYTQQAADYGKNSYDIGKQAQDIANQFGQRYADVGGQGARFEAGQLTTGTTPVAEGNAAVTAQTTAAQQTALAQGEQAALQGIGYQLTGANQAANAANSAAGQAYTGQGQQITGLNAAAGLAQPSPAAYGQTTFNPLEGGYAGGSGLPAETLQQYAQMAANGQYSAIPSSITSNPVLSAQLNAAAQAINPNFNPIQSAAAGNVLGTVPALQSANTAAKGIEQTINSFLDANPSLNSSDTALANAAQQWIQGKQLTDPRYQSLFNYLAEYTNTLAPILGVGGDATNLKTEIAQGFLNAKASGSSIKSVLANISQLADDKVRNIQSGALGGGTVAGGTSPGTPVSGGVVQTKYGAIDPSL